MLVATCAVASLLAIGAAIVPPQGSRDVWAYATYGRIAARYGASPYVVTPEHFPEDPYVERMHPNFRDDPSVYGPVFTGISALIVGIAGERLFMARLAFQMLAAAAAIACIILIAWRTRDAISVALVGLHPLTWATVVNGAHNDALLGLALLTGAGLAASHPIVAGVVLGLGAGVKIVGVVPLVAITLWLWRRAGRARALRLFLAGAVTIVVPYVVAGGIDAVRPLRTAGQLAARHSFWGHFGGGSASLIGIVVVGFLTLAFLRRLGEARSAEQVAGSSLVPYLLCAPYVLPWYAWWALPVLALRLRSPTVWIIAGIGGLLMVVYPGSTAGGSGLMWTLRNLAGPVIQLISVLALVVLVSVPRVWTGRSLSGWDRQLRQG